MLKNKPAESRPITSLSKQGNQKSIPVPETKTNPVQKTPILPIKAALRTGMAERVGEEVKAIPLCSTGMRGEVMPMATGAVRPLLHKPEMSAMPCISNQCRKKLESIGVINFPQKNGTRLYGQLTVRINVYHDGSLYEKAGGVSVVKSSGNPALDAAALKIGTARCAFWPF